MDRYHNLIMYMNFVSSGLTIGNLNPENFVTFASAG